MKAGPPRTVAWLLRRCLPDDVVGASIAGDLHEEYERDPERRWRGVRYVGAALGVAARYAGSRVLASLLQRQPERTSIPPQRRSAVHAICEDLRDAWRGLLRRPLFTLAGVGLLACGLAASSTVLSFVEAVMLRPLPIIVDAERLVRIQERSANARPGRSPFHNVIPADMERIAASAPSLEGTAAMLDGGSIPFSRPDGATRIPALRTTAGFFGVVGVYPTIGRAFTAEDERAGAAPVVVLSHAAWQRLFGGRADALGSLVTLAFQPHTVIGVMPRGFDFPTRPDIYLPLTQSAFTTRFHVATGLARVRKGVPLERVRAEVDAAVAAMAADVPAAGHGAGARVLAWRDSMTERVRPALRILVVAAGLVLALATANLGGLLIDRTTARRRELAVRRSLGATNARIVRLLLGEGLLLGVGGAVLGSLITAFTLRTVVALSPTDLPFRDAVRVDLRVLAFTGTLAVLAGLIAGLLPALRTRRGPMVVGERSGGAVRHARGSGLLVAGQIAVAMLLLSSAGLLIRSFATALHQDPGVRTEGILTAGVTLNQHSRYPDDTRQLAFFRDVLDSMRIVPGVTAAEVGLSAPLSGAPPVELSRQGISAPPQTLYLNAVSPGLLPLLRVPLLAGRGFESRDDDESAERVALVSRMAAARLFPGEEAVGQVLQHRDETYRVIGVVADVRQEGPLEDARPMLYVPFRRFNLGAGTFVLTGDLDPAVLATALRAVVRRLDPDLPVDRVQTLASLVDESLAQPRFYSVTVGVFGALALGLAVAGLYAVIAFAARRRMFEFGVRAALGARPLDNLWLVYRQGLTLSLAGVIVGLVLAFWAARALESMLYRTEPADPGMLALSGIVTLLVALAAVVTPAVRAARVDPVVALRTE